MNSRSLFGDTLERFVISSPGTRRRSGKRRTKRSNKANLGIRVEGEQLPAAGTMVRTKRLILAALRVWELKHGIRD
jgi:hypothetical protein